MSLKSVRAVFSVELHVSCPHCDEDIDLINGDHNMNEDCHMIRQAVPSEGHWMDEHKKFVENIKCPICEGIFEAKEIEW